MTTATLTKRFTVQVGDKMSNYLIRDSKSNPYITKAEDILTACQLLNLNPRKCTAEVLDTTVPYQKWDVVEIPTRLHPTTTSHASKRTVAKTTAIPTIPITCTVCGKNFLAIRSNRDTCSIKCRVQKHRNGKCNGNNSNK